MQKQWKDTLISSIVQFLSVLQMNRKTSRLHEESAFNFLFQQYL